MNDRELLELAAKAAGYKVRWHEIWKCFVHAGPFNTDNPPTVAGQRHVWVPLQDDGDALRLAVSLNFEIERSKSADRAYVGLVEEAPWVEYVSSKQDLYACTRRAIVRAAAEIGEAMP